MSPIHLLPDTLINQIAAGEVVENPASIVKELMENSIDAQATKIHVSLLLAGKKQIVVTDNGQGIAENDLNLCLQRHATSKLPDHDLNNIAFLGFRGEALPSIAAICDMTLASKFHRESQGWLIHGSSREKIPHAISQGTQIHIHNIFEKIPARLKFLKNDLIEFRNIVHIFKVLALMNPHIHCSLQHNDQEIFNFPAYDSNSQGYANRCCDVLSGNLFSKTFPIETPSPDSLVLHGHISHASHHFGTKNYQYFFVNRRPVKNNDLAQALHVAYKDILPHRRYPIAVLYLSVPSSDVDINVHPAKTEVRFRFNHEIRSFLISQIRNTLNKQKNLSPPPILPQILKKTFPSPPQEQTSLPLHGNALHDSALNPQCPREDSHSRIELIKKESLSHKTLETAHELFEPAPLLGYAQYQLFMTYILSQKNETLFLIDQHAAHERIIYEKMKQSLHGTPLVKQKLLFPEILSFSPEDISLFIAHTKTLQRMGIAVEKMSHHQILIRELPLFIPHLNLLDLFHTLADELHHWNTSENFEDHLHKICSTLACHSSIRAGDPLTLSQMDDLIKEMEKTPNFGQCNHGRPTYISLDKKMLDKLFHRT